MPQSAFPQPATPNPLGGHRVCCISCGDRFHARFDDATCPACGFQHIPPNLSTKPDDFPQADATLIVRSDQLMGTPSEIPADGKLARGEVGDSAVEVGDFAAASEQANANDIMPSSLAHLTVSYLAAVKAQRENVNETKEADTWESDEEFLRRIGNGLHVYHFESLLGSGGMGRVYLARHIGLRRRCAVKVLSPRVSQLDFDYVERFQHEGRAAAALNHPNIVITHAIGEERGFHFLEMEYVPGGSLRQLLREEGALPPIRATRLVERVAHGLAAAHRRGIVHRDLKSDNIMLTLAGVPKISDFGLAKTLHLGDAEEAAVLVGTPAFMAPELFAGAAMASGASDVYALGVIYFELLTGQLPFRAASLVDLRKAVQEAPLPNIRQLVKDIPLEMAECLARMLDKCPSNRPANGTEAAQLLAAVAGHAPDIHTLLTEAFADCPEVIWTRVGDAFQLRLQLPGGRKQLVTVAQNSAASSERLLMISSLCGPAEPSYFEEALRLNGVMSHGGITIQDVDGRPMFCAVNSYPRETVDPEEVRRSVMEIASRADAIERLLTTQDLH